MLFIVNISKFNSETIRGEIFIVHSIYVLYNIVPIAFLLLLVYVFIDVFLDYFRKNEKNNIKRVLLYSFMFYIISFIQIKFGGFTVPQNPTDNSRSFVSTNDWFGLFYTMHFNISIWSYSALLYNFILLVPFGMLISLLLNLKNNKIAIPIVIVSCLGIDFARLLLRSFDLTASYFSYTSIIYLIFNILGGIFGIFLVKYAANIVRSYRFTSEVKE